MINIKKIVRWELWGIVSKCLFASFAVFLPFGLVRYWLLPWSPLEEMLFDKLALLGVIVLIANILTFVEQRLPRWIAVTVHSVVFLSWLLLVYANVIFGTFNLPKIVEKAAYNGTTYLLIEDDNHFEPPWTTYRLTKWQALKSDSRLISIHGGLEIRYDEKTQLITAVQISPFDGTEVSIP